MMDFFFICENSSWILKSDIDIPPHPENQFCGIINGYSIYFEYSPDSLCIYSIANIKSLKQFIKDFDIPIDRIDLRYHFKCNEFEMNDLNKKLNKLKLENNKVEEFIKELPLEFL